MNVIERAADVHHAAVGFVRVFRFVGHGSTYLDSLGTDSLISVS